MTPAELLAECANILRGPLSPDDLAVWLCVRAQDGFPAQSRMLSHLRDERVRKGQGSASASILAERFGVSVPTIYRAHRRKCHKPPKRDTGTG